MENESIKLIDKYIEFLTLVKKLLDFNDIKIKQSLVSTILNFNKGY